jgi:outer membrane protein OmpA-like peptidoglycan-associated protein
MIRIISIFLLILALATQLSAQDREKAQKHFDKARLAFEAVDYKTASKEVELCLKADSTFTDAYILSGDILLETGDSNSAVIQYRNSLRFSPERPEIVYYLLGNTLFALEKYDDACPCYDSILNMPDIKPDLRQVIEVKLFLCRTRRELMDNPVPFQPLNLGKGVNTVDDEYINAVSADGSLLYFTRREPAKNMPGKEFVENFYFSRMKDETWQDAEKLGYPEGTENDAGALCISPDGNLLVFTSCFRRDGFGSCDLYYSERKGDSWTPSRNMGVNINSDLWDAQPSISSDGKTLYFASNRRGGYGSSDIWAVHRLPTGGWGKPYNLGPVVNSAEADVAPYIHYDNKTLYFSSNGLPGLGGQDLFKTVSDGSTWQQPKNLGYPINSSADDLVIIVNPDGETGYISNNSLEGEGGFDIFSFRLYPDIRPTPVTYLKGIVFDKETDAPLSARFELTDLETDSMVISSTSGASSGDFLVCLPLGKDYGLNVSCPGYLFYSDHFPLSEIKQKTDPVIRNIPMQKIAEGNVMVLNNIFYETDKYALQPSSFPELDQLVTFLKNNPGITVEISGHTDDVGSDDYNLELSERRAESVVNYLVSKGIDASRLTYKGYGESLPVASNETEYGRAKNRRTEIKITGVK